MGTGMKGVGLWHVLIASRRFHMIIRATLGEQLASSQSVQGPGQDIPTRRWHSFDYRLRGKIPCRSKKVVSLEALRKQTSNNKSTKHFSLEFLPPLEKTILYIVRKHLFI
jgi:hypothetical protein